MIGADEISVEVPRLWIAVGTNPKRPRNLDHSRLHWASDDVWDEKLEESEGFEPSVPLPALRISSATLSTTQPTLLAESGRP